MKLKRIAVLLPILLSLSLIFSSCNSIKTTNESSVLTVETSSTASIKGTEESSLPNGSVISKIETEPEISSTPSSKVSETNEQTPSISIEHLEDLTSEGMERADRLMNKVKNTDTDIIRFYDAKGTGLRGVGFQRFDEVAVKLQPDKTINDSNEIKKFIAELRLEKWTPKRFNLRSLAEAVIYISQDLHINLEAQHQGISWMSINSAESTNVYFVVPNDVYQNLLEYCK